MPNDTVIVEAAARLHFGLFDLHGSSGQRFGGIGAPSPGISVRVSVSLADAITAAGDDATRAAEFARRFLTCYGLSGGATIHVERAIPSHAGLGSGTQLALSIARALAELHGFSVTSPDLARAVGRARRSAVGTWTFDGGGFVVEGGKRVGAGEDTPAPLIARATFPLSWRCVVVVPNARPGVSGVAETAAFATLPPPDVDDVGRVSSLVLTTMLPALTAGDIAAFGAALTEVQEINGRWFAPAQGGTFARGPSTTLVGQLREWGAAGVGQSSWGPTVYAIIEGSDAASALAERARASIHHDGIVIAGPFPSLGAQVFRT